MTVCPEISCGLLEVKKSDKWKISPFLKNEKKKSDLIVFMECILKLFVSILCKSYFHSCRKPFFYVEIEIKKQKNGYRNETLSMKS